MLAGALFPPKQDRQDHGKLDDLRISGSQYGVQVPQVYGFGRVGGNIVWFQKDANGNHLVEHSKSIRSSKGGSREVGRDYSYTVTMAVLICRGPIVAVRKVRANDHVIYDADRSDPDGKYTLRFYLGTEDQEVDERIEAAEGTDNWTAYRGLAYMVAEDFPLDDFGQGIPNFNFEVAPARAPRQVEYHFEDSPGLLQDSSGFARHLTGTPVQVTAGYSGEAMRTNAAPVYVVTGSVADLQGTELTVQFALRWDGTSSTAIDRFRYKDTTSAELAWQFNINWLGEQLTVSHEGPTGVHVFHTIAFARSSTVWKLVKWVFVAGGTSQLYIDNVLTDEQPSPVTLTSLAISGAANHRIEFDGDSITRAVWDQVSAYASALDGEPPTVDQILEPLFEQVGLAPAEFDVTAAAAKSVTGYILASRVDVRQAIRELLMLTDLDLAEVDGQIVAIVRGGASVVTIPYEDLGAYVAEGGVEVDEPPDRVTARRLPVSELPYRLDLEYLSQITDYQQAQATAVRFSRVEETEEQVTVSTPLVLPDTYARRAAETLLYRQWWERVQFVCSVGPKYLYLAPGDIVTIPVASGLVRCRAEQIDADPFGASQLTLVQDAQEILTQYVTGPIFTAPWAGAPEATTTLFHAWSGNALLDEHALDEKFGFYVAAGGPLGQEWPGATLFRSRDGGATYKSWASFGDNATLGTAATALPAPPLDRYDVIDEVSTVDVLRTSGGAPDTVSEADVLNGANPAMIGDEIIQFVNAQSLGSNVYRLSRLLRGRRGTESFGGTHAIGDRFVLLEDESAKWLQVGKEWLGKTITLKLVTAGQTVASATAQSVVITAAEWKPYAPTSVYGTRDMSNNLTVTFIRRTRAGGQWADQVDVDQPEATLAYSVDILNTPGGTVLRTIAVSTETASYTAAEQTTDGLTPGNTVHLVVYQLGKLGRGYPKAASV